MLFIKRLRRTPILYALVTTGTVVGAIGGICSVAIDIFQLPTPPIFLLRHVVYIVVILFLLLLAIEYRSRRKSGPLGKTFEYDKDGVLWHGSEKAIAFRVKTFLGLLEEIGNQVSNVSLNEVFLKTGRISGNDFGQQFGTQIYPAELRKGGVSFDELSRTQRLKLWSEYDSSTGWGLLSVYEKSTSLDIHSFLIKNSLVLT